MPRRFAAAIRSRWLRCRPTDPLDAPGGSNDRGDRRAGMPFPSAPETPRKAAKTCRTLPGVGARCKRPRLRRVPPETGEEPGSRRSPAGRGFSGRPRRESRDQASPASAPGRRAPPCKGDRTHSELRQLRRIGGRRKSRSPGGTRTGRAPDSGSVRTQDEQDRHPEVAPEGSAEAERIRLRQRTTPGRMRREGTGWIAPFPPPVADPISDPSSPEFTTRLRTRDEDEIKNV